MAYGTAHAMLRTALATHLHTNPQDLKFRYDTAGKPRLEHGCSPKHQALDFSLSHTRGMACVAICARQRVGVDVEAVKRFDPFDATTARTVFSARELTWLNAAPDDQKAHIFAVIWTRKEAVAKAMGLGLSLPFQDFDVRVADDELITVNHAGQTHQFRHGHHLQDGFVFSAAVEVADGAQAAIEFSDSSGTLI